MWSNEDSNSVLPFYRHFHFFTDWPAFPKYSHCFFFPILSRLFFYIGFLIFRFFFATLLGNISSASNNFYFYGKVPVFFPDVHFLSHLIQIYLHCSLCIAVPTHLRLFVYVFKITTILYSFIIWLTVSFPHKYDLLFYKALK